jgi:hypothetical protein
VWLSPKLVHPADVEILYDVVLALSGRLSSPPLPALPAELLGVTGASALPPDYASAVRRGFLEKAENGEEELHVPIADAAALEILRHDAVRFGSVAVTMDGRAWQPAALLHGDGDRIIYRRGERLRIDCSADHAKLTVEWPETLSSWSGGLPPRGPFELFGREWRAASWEMDGAATLLHLTFSRVIPIADSPPHSEIRDRLQPASVDTAWAELERALAESVLQNSGEPVEQMRRAELIPLGRALYRLAEGVRSNSNTVEQHVRAARYHHASVAQVYDRAPWRILPEELRASLAARRVRPEILETLCEIFSDAPPVSGQATRGAQGHSKPPSRAA